MKELVNVPKVADLNTLTEICLGFEPDNQSEVLSYEEHLRPIPTTAGNRTAKPATLTHPFRETPRGSCRTIA